MSAPEKKPFSVRDFLEIKMNKKMQERPEALAGMDCIYQFEIEDDIWNLDLLSTKPHQIKSGEHSDPDCTIKISAENFEKLVRGNLNVPLAILSGKLKIKGDKALALKLAKLFS